MARKAASTDSKNARKRISWKSLKQVIRVFGYVRPYRWAYLLGGVFLLFSVAATLVFPLFVGRMVDVLETDAIDDYAVLLVGIFLASAVFSYFRIYLFDYGAHNGMALLRQTVYAHMVRLPMNFFSTRRVGELNSRLASDVTTLQSTFTTTLAEMCRQFIMIIGGVVLIAQVSGQLTLFMLAVIPVIMVAAVVFGWFVRKLSKDTQDLIAQSNTISEETLQGIVNVKAYANELFEIARYKGKMREVVKVALKGSRWRGMFVSFVIFSMFSAIVLIVWYALHLKAQGEINMGGIITFVMYTAMIGAAFAGVANLYSELAKAVGATETLLDILDQPLEELPGSESEQAAALNLEGRIELSNVAFHYPSRPDIEVLHDISINIRPGERVALVGPSGSGKSTVAALLLRFWDPNSGSINIDGKPAQEYDLNRLREQMALVPQEVILFGGTIRENIAYGKHGATEQEIMAAAEKANALEFIQGFPEGLDTIVGERGVQLSGGQRQRIAIARAVIKDPKILLLDEATSSLDSESEKKVQEALDQVMEGRTSVVIAHRLSTIRKADRIVVLEKGRIAESGSHEELMAQKGGIYQKLSQLQLEEF